MSLCADSCGPSGGAADGVNATHGEAALPSDALLGGFASDVEAPASINVSALKAGAAGKGFVPVIPRAAESHPTVSMAPVATAHAANAAERTA